MLCFEADNKYVKPKRNRNKIPIFNTSPVVMNCWRDHNLLSQHKMILLFVYSKTLWWVFVLFFFVLRTLFSQFLWIVHVFIAPSIFSNVYIRYNKYLCFHSPVNQSHSMSIVHLQYGVCLLQFDKFVARLLDFQPLQISCLP